MQRHPADQMEIAQSLRVEAAENPSTIGLFFGLCQKILAAQTRVWGQIRLEQVLLFK